MKSQESASYEAEQTVLGQAFLSKKCATQILVELEVGDFYWARHQLIFQAMQELHQEQQPVDVLLVAGRIDEKQLKRMGGVSYLVSLGDRVPTLANWAHHCRILRDYSAQRKMYELGQQIERDARALPYEELSEQISQTMKEIDARRKPKKKLFKTGAMAVREWIEWEQALVAGEISYLETGFEQLDDLSPINDDDLIILGARPGIGKTALALSVMAHVSGVNNEPSLMFSSEMSARRLVQRLIASESRYDLRTAIKTKDDKLILTENVIQACERISNWPIFIDDTGRATAAELCSRAKKKHEENGGLRFIIIDYLQNVESDGNAERQAQIDEASKRFKDLAVELQTPVLALSQFNRDFEKRAKDKGFDVMPSVSDLRDSGGIEQSADSIWLFHRAWNEHGLAGEEGVVVIAKSRDGQTGLMWLKLDGPTQRFREFEGGFL